MTGCLDLLFSNTGGSRLGEEAYRSNKINSELATAEADSGCTVGPPDMATLNRMFSIFERLRFRVSIHQNEV